MSNGKIWMPLYIGDYLTDTMNLSAEQHGAYLLLIMHYWQSSPLPDDDGALAVIARTERREWKLNVGPTVRRFSKPCEGRLQHKRIDHEIEISLEHASRRKRAADVRWGKQPRASDTQASALQIQKRPRRIS